MTTTTFDTLKFANTLKAAGVPDKQAEAQASVLAEDFTVNSKELATKDDLLATKNDLTAAMGSLRSEMGSLRLELQSDLRATEQRLNAKIDNHAAKFDGQITLLKWMIGLSISLSVAVLIRLFIVRPL
jgi:Protein of unknown function (DUF1640)